MFYFNERKLHQSHGNDSSFPAPNLPAFSSARPTTFDQGISETFPLFCLPLIFAKIQVMMINSLVLASAYSTLIIRIDVLGESWS